MLPRIYRCHNLHAKGRLFSIHLKNHSATQRVSSRGLCSKKDELYLHISPCGDWWNGAEVFAAKHLQPDYVKSILIPEDLVSNFEEVLENYDGEDLDDIMKLVYDDGDINKLRPIFGKKK